MYRLNDGKVDLIYVNNSSKVRDGLRKKKEEEYRED